MIKPKLPKSLFWDVKYEEIDFDKNARFIIGRVLMRGDLEHLREITHFYGLDRIKEETLNIRYLDKKTLSFLSNLFNIPKEEFRCYNTDPSIQKLWNY